MPRSAAPSTKGKVFGSLRLHPYAQKLPIDPPSNISQPKPTRERYGDLGYYRRSKSKSSSTRRRREQTLEFSASNDDDAYDADDDMSPVLMQNVEPISYNEVKYGRTHGIEEQDTVRPRSPPCPILPNINQGSSGANYLRLMAARPYSGRTLPFPITGTPYDEISRNQRERLDRGPVKFLNLASIATRRSEAEVQALLYPRECIDEDGNKINRFVTDCSKTSGRVYDRLFRRELARIIPYVGTSVRELNNYVFDVYTGAIRKRCMFDDLRDTNARTEGCLDIIEHECDFDYKLIPAS